jgi:N-ethylmaleimide reductase
MLQKLFTAVTLGKMQLRNRIVMSPMTRNRATTDHDVTDIMANYYAQRATAGLIITEGVAPSPNGNGYARVPGLYTAEQIAGWKKVTEAVHREGGHIFVQLMHSGRIAHPANMHMSGEPVAPSAIRAQGEMYTDTEGMQQNALPRELTTEEVHSTIREFVEAAQNAVEAGFDGVELHGANGYLIEQFINPNTNQRTDDYGGSIENRCRFLMEIARKTGEAIGFEKVGVRLSPYGAFNDMQAYPDVDRTYAYIAQELKAIGVVYLHLVNHESMGSPAVPEEIITKIRAFFTNTLILSGGYDGERAEKDLEDGRADLIAFGRPLLANPDLVERLRTGAALNQPDYTTLYTPGEKGYTDYPALERSGL